MIPICMQFVFQKAGFISVVENVSPIFNEHILPKLAEEFDDSLIGCSKSWPPSATVDGTSCRVVSMSKIYICQSQSD